MDTSTRYDASTADSVRRHLLVRAESYARGGRVLRTAGDTQSCVMYETIARELRQVAAEVVEAAR